MYKRFLTFSHFLLLFLSVCISIFLFNFFSLSIYFKMLLIGLSFFIVVMEICVTLMRKTIMHGPGWVEYNDVYIHLHPLFLQIYHTLSRHICKYVGEPATVAYREVMGSILYQTTTETKTLYLLRLCQMFNINNISKKNVLAENRRKHAQLRLSDKGRSIMRLIVGLFLPLLSIVLSPYSWDSLLFLLGGQNLKKIENSQVAFKLFSFYYPVIHGSIKVTLNLYCIRLTSEKGLKMIPTPSTSYNRFIII